jgi:hypothetical protein
MTPWVVTLPLVLLAFRRNHQLPDHQLMFGSWLNDSITVLAQNVVADLGHHFHGPRQ